VPDAKRAVNEIEEQAPELETVPAPRIKPYTSMIVPAVLLMVPALKNVVYPLKIFPSVTEFACSNVGLNDTLNSYDFIG
jgi:hypothetical protein